MGKPQGKAMVEWATPSSQDLLDQLDWAKQHDEDSARPSQLEVFFLVIYPRAVAIYAILQWEDGDEH